MDSDSLPLEGFGLRKSKQRNLNFPLVYAWSSFFSSLDCFYIILMGGFILRKKGERGEEEATARGNLYSCGQANKSVHYNYWANHAQRKH